MWLLRLHIAIKRVNLCRPVDMAAMLTGGQKLGLLSTTNLTNVTPLTSATPGASSLNYTNNVNFHEDTSQPYSAVTPMLTL